MVSFGRTTVFKRPYVRNPYRRAARRGVLRRSTYGRHRIIRYGRGMRGPMPTYYRRWIRYGRYRALSGRARLRYPFGR